MASRAVGRGLSKIEPASPNTLIAYAARAGSTAADGDARNSPFTTALVKYLPKPGLDLRKAFGFVRDDVLKVTHNRQEPFVYGSLGGEDVALVPAAPAPPSPPVDPLRGRPGGLRTRDADQRRVGLGFLHQQIPFGLLYDLAMAQRKKLIAVQDAAAEEARLAAVKSPWKKPRPRKPNRRGPQPRQKQRRMPGLPRSRPKLPSRRKHRASGRPSKSRRRLSRPRPPRKRG